MSLAPGQKARLLNLIDNEKADLVQPLYSIDITVGISPAQNVKCGAITVFRLNKVAQDFEDKLNPKDFSPDSLKHAQARAAEIQKEVNSQTEVMHQDPIFFKQTEGRWIEWAIEKAFEISDRLGAAKISVKCPKLRIKVVRSPSQVAEMRSRPADLFPVIRDIDALLDKGYAFDPWSETTRRGRIGADLAKR